MMKLCMHALAPHNDNAFNFCVFCIINLHQYPLVATTVAVNIYLSGVSRHCLVNLSFYMSIVYSTTYLCTI